MRRPLLHLAVLCIMTWIQVTGCASVAANTRLSPDPAKTYPRKSGQDFGKLTEREKWRLARDAYSQASRAQARRHNEVAAYYFEVALELLGSLDMASVEVPTQRVLSFQRRVLQTYGKFLEGLETIPETAGPMAILEGGGERNAIVEQQLEAVVPKADVHVPPAALPRNPRALPDVPFTKNSQVAGQINFFMNKGRNVMLRWMERSTVMFPRLRPILAEEGIPDEVMYLAMIESGLNPRAYSYAHAAGVWQFIAGTGRIYGLNVDRVYDERLHVEASTRAACRHLRKLYEQFGDWYLAFAAYNCGELRIERELARSPGRDFWGIQHRLPRQTRNYVPAYLATRAICENPTFYGFPPLPREVPFECERVWVEGAYSLDHIAQAAGVDATTVKELNPEFLKGVTPSGGKYQVRLPQKPDAAFESRLATMPKTVVAATKTHRVRRGETLGQIADRYGVSVAAIKALPENRRVKANRLQVGQQIVIPVAQIQPATVARAATESVTDAGPANRAGSKPTPDGGIQEIIYTVHRGETLGKISQQLGVSVSEICRQNNIKNPNVISPGQKLRIRVDGGSSSQQSQPSEPVAVGQEPRSETAAASTAVAAPVRNREIHVVQRGDTVWSIARTYGQSPLKILEWNNLTREDAIFPGQKLIVSR